MSEFFGGITVSTLSGEVLSYIVDLDNPAYVLKWFIKKDTGIDINQQQLFFNKVINKLIN